MKSPTPEEPEATKNPKLPPATDKRKGITRKAFGELLKRAISPRAPKPAPKST